MAVEPTQVQDPQSFIVDSIRMLMARREETGGEVTRDAHLNTDLGLDSLELAELSVLLEDNLGRDPYSEGIVPATVGEIIDFYG